MSMERLTEKTVGCFEYALKDHKAVPGEFGTYDAFFDYSMAVKRLGHYEDTGLEPEDLKKAFNETAILKLAAQALSTTPDHLRDLIQAEQEGRLVVLDEKTALSMYAGARAIENNKRLFGATYVYDVFGKQGGPKEIPYFDAANNLRNIASAMAQKGGER